MAEDTTKQADRGLGTSTPSFRAGDVVISCQPWVWSFKYEQHKIFCAECFRESQNLRSCSNCKLYRYCDERCQVINWEKEHKHECGMLKKIRTKYNQKNHDRDGRVDESDFEQKMVDACAAEILVAKAIRKFQTGDEYELSKSSVRLSPVEVLDVLPYDPSFEDRFKSSVIGNRVWKAATIGQISDFKTLLRKICYNVLPIWDPQGKVEVVAAGIFPEALHREMTPVCWDVNVSMDMQGRVLVVRAMKDILNYTGLKDLRQNELMGSIFLATLSERRMVFEWLYPHPCTCYKCTPEYDAEINPLKCSTSGCTARIPSDIRALRPCLQCGPINGDRLHQLMKLKEKYETIVSSPALNSVAARDRLTSFFWEVHQADILQPDAHFRLVCGCGMFFDQKHCEETWNICSGMIACIRAVFPKYDLNRAYWLVIGCNAVISEDISMSIVSHVEHPTIHSAQFKKFCSEAVEWVKESRDIHGIVSGKGSKWERSISSMLGLFEQITLVAKD